MLSFLSAFTMAGCFILFMVLISNASTYFRNVGVNQSLLIVLITFPSNTDGSDNLLSRKSNRHLHKQIPITSKKSLLYIFQTIQKHTVCKKQLQIGRDIFTQEKRRCSFLRDFYTQASLLFGDSMDVCASCLRGVESGAEFKK